MDKAVKGNWIKRNWLKLYFVFIILILIMLSVGSVLDFISYSTGEKADAVVTEVINKREKRGARGQTSEKVTKVKIRYSIDGTEYSQEIKLQGWYKLRTGDSLKVSCDPENPEKVIIPQRLYQGIKFDILWGLFVGIQLGLVIKFRRKKDKPQNDDHTADTRQA